MDTEGGKRDGKNWDTEIDPYTLLILCIKEISNENLCIAQCSVVT